jgi:hypothetical protein
LLLLAAARCPQPNATGKKETEGELNTSNA